MEGNLGRVGRLGGQIGARSPQGQGRGHFFDSFEKPVAQAERCFAEPPGYALARIAADLLILFHVKHSRTDGAWGVSLFQCFT